MRLADPPERSRPGRYSWLAPGRLPDEAWGPGRRPRPPRRGRDGSRPRLGVVSPGVANDPEFRYSDLLPTGPDETPYRLITTEGV